MHFAAEVSDTNSVFSLRFTYDGARVCCNCVIALCKWLYSDEEFVELVVHFLVKTASLECLLLRET